MFAALALVLAADPLQVAEAAIDAGEVRVGPPLVRRFIFTNAGNEPLMITDVRSSCGCLVPSLAKRVYEPGQRGELAVEVNTLSQPAGPHRWIFSLGYRCGAAAGERNFELTANLRQEIEITPAAIAFRGNNPPPALVTIRDRRSRPLTVRSVVPSVYLKAKTNGNAVEVRVADDCPEGRHAVALAIMTDDPDYREIKLPVTIDRQPRRRVTALPARVTLVTGGSTLVQLKADEPVRVEAIEASTPALTCRWTPGPGDRATVRIGLDRSKWDGQPFNGELRVRLKAPSGETIPIPVSVRAEE
jgi:hypothetical protein